MLSKNSCTLGACAISVKIELYPGLLGQNSPKYMSWVCGSINKEASQIKKPLCCFAISSTIGGKQSVSILQPISTGKTKSPAQPTCMDKLPLPKNLFSIFILKAIGLPL